MYGDLIMLLWLISPIILIIIICTTTRSKNEEIKNLTNNLSDARSSNYELRKTIRENDEQLLLQEDTIHTLSQSLENRNSHFKKIMQDNLTSIPYLSGLISDYLTYDIEVLAKELDWGFDERRLKKVKSIREIRNDAKDKIAQYKTAEYQLEYLLSLFPDLKEIVDTSYKELPPTFNFNQGKSQETSSNYISDEEWSTLSSAERSQRELNRYIQSHKKSSWQIGRDYEMFIGYLYEQKGWDVYYSGTLMKLEDLGRDLIISKGGNTEIIQCKYWSKTKFIHEKHIFQLYGTTVSYMMENGVKENVTPRFITNIRLSSTAKKVAEYLGVEYVENQEIGAFPRIKCNVNRDTYGSKTRIYHLPTDQQYDSIVIDQSKGEFLAFSAYDAEARGFRRAYKWHGN